MTILNDKNFTPKFELSNDSTIDVMVKNHLNKIDEIELAYAELNSINKAGLDMLFQASNIPFAKNFLNDELLTKAKRNQSQASWRLFLRHTGILDILPAKRHGQVIDGLESKNLPEFSVSTVKSTLMDWSLQANTYFAEKVESVFKALSYNHKTNSSKGFKEKMIIRTRSSTNLHELRSCIATLYKMQQPEQNQSESLLSIAFHQSDWMVIDQGAIKIKAFDGAGTIHIQVHEDIAESLNIELARINPNAIADQYRTNTNTAKEKKFTYKTDCLTTQTLSQLADILVAFSKGRKEFICRKDSYKYSKELSDVLCYIGAKKHNDYSLLCTSDMKNAIHTVLRNMGIPEQVSHQFYETPDEIVNDLNTYLDGCSSEASYCDPSAGRGALSLGLIGKNLKSIEINDLHCEILKVRGFTDIKCADFLKQSATSIGTFDYFIMNPPYSENRLYSHLLKAKELLNEAGEIIAVVPSGTISKIQEKLNMTAHVLHSYGGVFSDTNIKTSLVVIS